jgi:hypothetical protein
MTKKSVRPGVIFGRGIGEILFGMTVKVVESTIGRADGASISDSGDQWILTLRYPGLDLVFDAEDDFRLSIIEVGRGSRCSLFGKVLFPSSLARVRELLQENLPGDLNNLCELVPNPEIKEQALILASCGVAFYFDLSGQLRSVSWRVPFGPKDEPEWPLAATAGP